MRRLAFILISMASLARPLEALPTVIAANNLVTGAATHINFKKAKGTVIVFLSSECPCSESHQGKLAELAKRFREYQFFGVYADEPSHIPEGKSYFAKAGLPFPVLSDPKREIVDLFSPLKTPHAFIVDPQGQIQYRGAVSNSHEAPAATRFYLASALQSLNEGKEPDPNITKPLGCAISR